MFSDGIAAQSDEVIPTEDYLVLGYIHVMHQKIPYINFNVLLRTTIFDKITLQFIIFNQRYIKISLMRVYLRNVGCLLLFSLGLCCSLKAQMTVSPGNVAPYTPENLVTNVFLGDGVEVTSVSFNGDAAAVGYFQNSAGIIGIDRGIIMTTGLASSAPGIGCTPTNPNACGNNNLADSNNSGGSDADLATASGQAIDDASIYTITFIPTSDTLEFEYVFASEEYENYTCSTFNDAFGFFISGPGISGPYTGGAENIALVPGTTLPVAINTVNGGFATGSGSCTSLAYSSFFNNNFTNPNAHEIEYSGFTNVFTARAIVTPCEIYTIKLAIGDGFDDMLDSGVFLAAKSFGTGSIEVEATTVSVDGSISEGCTDAIISFVLPNPVENDFPLNYSIEGTATNGVDYTFIPDDIFIPMGEDSVGIVVSGIEDGMDEGIETLQLIVQTDVCFFDTIDLKITENQLTSPVIPDETICPGQSVSLDASVPIVVPPPITFTNSNSELITTQDVAFTFPINVSGVPFDEVGPNILQSICLNLEGFTFDMDIFLQSPTGQVLELTTGNGYTPSPNPPFDPATFAENFTNTCFTENSINPINFNPNGSSYAPGEAGPFTGNFQPETPFSDLFGSDVNGTWELVVYYGDLVPFNNGVNFIEWSITFNNVYSLSYDWSPVDGLSCNDCEMPEASPISTTTYTLVITDTYGCDVTETVTVNVITALDPPILSCGAASPNSVTVNWDAIPGADAYEVSVDGAGWISPNPGPLTHTVTGLALGQIVTIEVRGLSNACGTGTSTSITCNTSSCGLSGNVDSTSDISCFGADDGTANLSATGTGTIMYDFGGGNSNATGAFIGLSEGTYTVTITDDLCSVTETVTINEPLELTASQTFTDVSCNGNTDGTISVTPSGGTPNYTFAWDNGIMDTDGDVSGLSPNTYSATITDNNGCTATISQVISENPAISLSTSQTNVECNGVNNGTATVTATGGTGSYTYQWDANASNQTTATATGLGANTYNVTVTDSDNCTQTTSVTILETSDIVLSFSHSPTACSSSSDGSIMLTVTGGAAGYTYNWDNGAAPIQNPTGLSAIEYCVTVTDANGCTAQGCETVTASNAIVTSITGTDVSCFGGNDGTATVTASGGTGTLTYAWSSSPNTSSTETMLPLGTYTVTITDSNGCFETESITINEPTELMLSATNTNVSCFAGSDGSIDLTVQGGTGTYSYAWSNSSTVEDPTGLPQGTYTVVVTDENNCTATMPVTINEPAAALSLTPSSNQTICFGASTGNASVTASNGTPPYSYLWNNGETTDNITNLGEGTYTVLVTDDNACTATTSVTISEFAEIELTMSGTNVSCFGGNDGTVSVSPIGGDGFYTYAWSTGGTSDSEGMLQAGTYTVTVIDGQGCEAIDNITLNEPDELLIDLVKTDILCFGQATGEVNVTVTGGTGVYTYNWNANTIITEDLSNLTPGDYDLIVTDANGCSATVSTTIIQPASPLMITPSADQTICSATDSGTANISANGGTPPYSYLWNNGELTSSISDLAGGTYDVTVTDANGCEEESQVLINELTPIISELSSTGASCFDALDGTATIDLISGGAGSVITDYSVLWNTSPPSNNLTVTGLQGGQTYTVTITDSNACEHTNSVQIANPLPIEIALSNEDLPACNGSANGAISVIVSNGTTPYSYAWNTGETTADISGLPAGTYTLSVTDANGCTEEFIHVLTQPTSLDIQMSGMAISCANETDGWATVQIIGGSGGYTYNWSNGETTDTITNLGVGVYEVTVTDVNSCSISGSFEVEGPNPIVAIPIVEDVSCNGDRDGSISFTVSGGTFPYLASLDGIEYFGVNNFQALYPGEYSIYIQDANGCVYVEDSIVVREPDEVLVNIIPDTSIITIELGDSILLDLDYFNTVGNVNIEWSNLYGNNLTCTDCPNPWILDYENNQYQVTVMDENGCIGTDEIEVIIERDRDVFVPSGFTPNGDLTNDVLMVHGNEGTIVQTFRVYDRWGELVFRADDYPINSTAATHVWDGTFGGNDLNSAVFVWFVEVRYIDGRRESFSGNSTLIR